MLLRQAVLFAACCRKQQALRSVASRESIYSSTDRLNDTARQQYCQKDMVTQTGPHECRRHQRQSHVLPSVSLTGRVRL